MRRGRERRGGATGGCPLCVLHAAYCLLSLLSFLLLACSQIVQELLRSMSELPASRAGADGEEEEDEGEAGAQGEDEEDGEGWGLGEGKGRFLRGFGEVCSGFREEEEGGGGWARELCVVRCACGLRSLKLVSARCD